MVMKKLRTSFRRVSLNGFCVLVLAGMMACSGEKRSGEENESASAGPTSAEPWDNERFFTEHASTLYFQEWDLDGDSYLDEKEYLQGEYRSWDTNQDNQIDENEWRAGYKVFRTEPVGWADWDIDASRFLSENEYRAGYNKAGWTRTWDTDGDGRLSEREYSDGLFKRFDRNGDGLLDEKEYRAFQNYLQKRTGTQDQ
jgi:glycine/D-amino acid oxidase-like deaminating enzyme